SVLIERPPRGCHPAPKSVHPYSRSCRRNWLKSLRLWPKEINIPIQSRAFLAAKTPDPVDEFAAVARCGHAPVRARSAGRGDRGEFMRRFLLALVVLALPALATAAPIRLPDQPSKESILGWMNTYRLHPDPDRLPVAVKAMSRMGLIT